MKDFLCELERELMIGGGRWIAEFNESERNYKLENLTFDICLKGDTKIRGPGLFSRAISALLLPRYLVACYVLTRDTISLNFLKSCVSLVKKCAKKDNVKWSWIVFVLKNDPSEEIVKFAENYNDEEVGLLLYDLTSKLLINSKNKLGERMRACLKIWSKKSRQ